MRGMYLGVAALFVAFVAGTPALAMPISQFERMDFRDRSEYRTLLVKGVYDDLTERGQTGRAEALLSFFKDRSENGGFRQFDRNLDMMRTLDEDASDKTRADEVEDVMELTLKNAGIPIPVTTLQEINRHFKPSYAPAKGDANAPTRQTT